MKTKAEARQYAIDYQQRASKQNLSYEEILQEQDKLIKLAKKFRLVEEFEENGLI